MPDLFTTTVRHCARCDEDHEVTFTKFFGHPVEDEDGTIWNWWALCPITGDPILMTGNKRCKHALEPVGSARPMVEHDAP